MRSFALVLGALLIGGAASADVVHLRSGGSIEGRVVAEGDKVVVEVPHGTISFPKEKVLRIERQDSDLHAYGRKRAALAAGDAGSRVRLAEWCAQRGLGNRREELLREALEIDPDHAAARRLAGYLRHEGRWVTPRERNLAAGLVEFEGRWHKPESVAAIKKARAEAEEARERRRKAELDLRIKAAELEKLRAERARLEVERRELDSRRAQLEAERLRLERLLLRYPRFRLIGDDIYYYPDYPRVRERVIVIRSSSKKSGEPEAKK
jgi:hypothetical protein